MSRILLALLTLAALCDARSPKRFKDRDLPLTSLYNFQVAGSLAAGSGGTSTLNGSNLWKGLPVNRLTAGSASTPIWVYALPSTNICNDSFFDFVAMTPNRENILNLNSLSLFIGNNLSNYISYEFGSFDLRDTGITFPGEWTHFHLLRRRFAQTGTFQCATVDTLAIGHKAQSGTQDTVFLAEVSRFPKRDTVGILMIHEDDQWSSWDSLAFPTLLSMEFKSNIFVNGSRVDQPNFSTMARMKTMCASGLVKFGNHLWAHDSITDLGFDSAQHSMERNIKFIQGFGPACDESRLMAYPFGRHSVAIDSAQRKWGLADYARTTKGNSFGESQGFNNPYGVRIVLGMGNNTDTTEAKALLDTLATYHTAGIFLFHRICASCTPSDANMWRQDWFIAVMNYAQALVNAGRLRIMTTGEYLQAYGAGIGPAQRAGIGR